MNINTDMLRDIASFLADDRRFSCQIVELDKVIKFFDKKQSVKNLPTADQIWSIIDEDRRFSCHWPYEITLDAPLGCTLKVVTVGNDVYVEFYDKGRFNCHFLFWNEDMTSADIEKHCQEYDYWADHFEFL